jgi:hypothetical protein
MGALIDAASFAWLLPFMGLVGDGIVFLEPGNFSGRQSSLQTVADLICDAVLRNSQDRRRLVEPW